MIGLVSRASISTVLHVSCQQHLCSYLFAGVYVPNLIVEVSCISIQTTQVCVQHLLCHNVFMQVHAPLVQPLPHKQAAMDGCYNMLPACSRLACGTEP